MSSNRTTLAELQELSTDEVAKLPVDHLHMLIEDVDVLTARAKSLNEKLDTALDKRFSNRAKTIRTAEGKDTGRVRFNDGEFDIIADSPKAIVWDQKSLAGVANVIRDEWKEDPTDYLSVKYTVAESKFTAWPPVLKKLFEPARIVRSGKPSYQIVAKKGDA